MSDSEPEKEDTAPEKPDPLADSEEEENGEDFPTFSPIDSEVESEGEGEVDVGMQPTLRARPSNMSGQDTEAQVEVSNTVAFHCLDELFQQGKLTGTEVAQLKARYSQLADGLEKSRDCQFQMLQQSKLYTTEVESQILQLSKADAFPDKITTEVGRLREQLLKSQNTLMAIEERADENAYKIETLKEEKRLLEREYQRMPKAEEIEKQKKLLQDSSDEIRLEIDKYLREKKKIKENVRSSAEQEKELESQCDQARIQLDKLKGELLAINSVPVQISKEREKLRKKINEHEKELDSLNQELTTLRNTIESLEKSTMACESETAELRNSNSKEQERLSKAQEDFDNICREMDLDREKEMTLLADKASIELNFRHLALERRNLHEIHTRKLREKDREVRALKKAQLQLKVAEEGLSLVQQMHDKAKVTYDMCPKEDRSDFERRTKLQNEVDGIKRNLEMEYGQKAVQGVKVQQSVQEEERLLYEISDLRIEVVELTRLVAIKADEREQKARDFMRADMRYDRAAEDLKSKQLQIKDHNKKFKEMQVRLKDFAKLYDVIKTQRNKCVNLIQTTTQKASEMREKLRILHNEVEILRANLQTKEKQLAKLRMKHASGIVMRDTLRHELSKEQRFVKGQNETRDQLRVDMQRLNHIINRAEESMVQLRKTCDRNVQNRNDRGVQLIERNEEVYILQEKVKIQETLIRDGEIELKGREEEINFLQRHLEEEKRKIALLKKEMPNKRNIESELSTVQIQLSLCQDHLVELESEAENPEASGRLRFLGGNDLAPVDLQNKLELLEHRLALKEEQLLERDLLHDAVTRLVDQVKKKALSGKEDTLNLAKDVNNFKSDMGHVTKKMKATTAELTMYMAQALRLQQEVRDKEFNLEQCYRRMEKGEPPSEEIEHEWRRVEEMKVRKQRDTEFTQMMADEEAQYQLTNGGVTTAEPRPNAYIPDDDAELPIPRPYGAHAPFRPTEQGSNMRHVRKPKLKPIEI